MSRISNLSASISRCGLFLLLIVQWFSESLHHVQWFSESLHHVQWFSESLHHAKASSVVKTLITSKEYCN